MIEPSNQSTMNNKKLQALLKTYPDNLSIKLMVGSKPTLVDFTDENILLTSETAFLNKDVPEEEWDTEDGKIELGDGKQYLLLNPIIM